MIDIYSRYIVRAHVHTCESGPLAVDMMTEVFNVHGVPHAVHADRGTSMTSKTVAALLADLEVTRSHSRPQVSNDNPYSEAWFKTLKYAPVFPERFGSLQAARAFMSDFVDSYNHHHRHLGLGLHTPADVHYGHATDVQQRRLQAVAAGPAAAPHPIHVDCRHPQDPQPAGGVLDQPTSSPDTSCLTRSGLTHLHKFRGSPYSKRSPAVPSRAHTRTYCGAGGDNRESLAEIADGLRTGMVSPSE